MLQILDIKKSFGELHVLRGVDLDVEQGDVVAIIGARPAPVKQPSCAA